MMKVENNLSTRQEMGREAEWRRQSKKKEK